MKLHTDQAGLLRQESSPGTTVGRVACGALVSPGLPGEAP